MFDQLDDVRTDLSNRLIRAAKDRKSPMHVPAVVTSDVDARGMVLREFDSAAFTLRFHTDTRAPKVAAIEADPRVAVLFYDKGAKIQIRVRGTAEILRDAPVLLLDEATSALDAASERAVQTAVDALAQDRTTIIVAHRLATVKKADRIVVFDEGRIVAEGTHDSLVAEGGLYSQLAKLQFTDGEKAA